MNVFWKTFLGGMLCIALLFGGRYAKAWLGNSFSGERMTQAERVKAQNEAIDRALHRSYATSTAQVQRTPMPPNYVSRQNPPNRFPPNRFPNHPRN